MFSSSTVRKTAEAVAETAPIDPTELVPLAQLSVEGFGPWDSPYTKGPRDVIDALAAQLDGEVVLDDLGRRCVSREVARRLFSERAEAERRQREVRQRHEEVLAASAAANRPRGGIPIPEGLEGVDALTVMMQQEIEAKAERKGARQRSTLDEMFTGGLTYHPVRDEDES